MGQLSLFLACIEKFELILFFNFSHPSQKLLTPAQYGMSYRPAKSDEMQRNRGRVHELSTSQFIVSAAGEEVQQRPLVMAHWSGSRLMILRSTPIVLGYCRFEKEEEEHSRLYSELLLFRPWKEDGRFLFTRPTLDECRTLHAQQRDAIVVVREELKKLLVEQII